MQQLPIQIDQCQLTRVGAEFSPSLTLNEWVKVGEQLFAIGSCYQFLLGDWLNYGERKYGEKYKLACEETGLDYQTLREFCWTCNQVTLLRRRNNLSYSHHREVAPLDTDEQDKWLDEAIRNKWSVADLRQAMRKAKATYTEGSQGEPKRTFVGCVAEAIRMINNYTQERPLSEWDEIERRNTKQVLAPLVEIWEKL